ncbi:MAG: radical SAM protein [Kiritimatiellae bacterium]|nr:radical SAM protein [Kiritimatiellia bacterium]
MRRLKGVLKGWLLRLSLALPPRAGMYLINRSPFWGRPVLDYLEFHLADHCNLNCAGCLHYAPFAEPHLADAASFRRDLSRLAILFSNVRHVRLMGGEPLLHPDAADFVKIARETFPASSIRVVTNGVKLAPPIDEPVARLLSAMAESHVGIDWTKYPPLAGRDADIRRVCDDAGVDLRVTENSLFMARLRPEGGSGIRRAFKWCRHRLYCPILKDGRIYLCAPACYAAFYNKRAGTRIPEELGIDIHSASAKDIMLYLMSPSFSCSHCAEGMRQFAWKGNAKPEDWVL